MNFSTCPVCLRSHNGPFTGIGVWAPSSDSTRYSIGAVDNNGRICCSIGPAYDSYVEARIAAENTDIDEVRAESETYEDGGSYNDSYDDCHYGD